MEQWSFALNVSPNTDNDRGEKNRINKCLSLFLKIILYNYQNCIIPIKVHDSLNVFLKKKKKSLVFLSINND